MATISPGLQDAPHGLYEIVLAGSFTGDDRPSFTSLLAEARYQKTTRHIALNCEQVTFLHREGLSLLLETKKDLTDNGCYLYLVAPSPAVKLRLNRTLSDSLFSQLTSLAALIEELEHPSH